MKTNLQPVEKVVGGLGLALDVMDVWSTIQGEGPFTGTPATFIRLAGCNLMCPLCDTNYTAGRKPQSIDELIQRVAALGNELIVITGGEPFRQNLTRLCFELCDMGYLVQVETNGVIDPSEEFQDLKVRVNFQNCRLCVVCSPKTSKVSGSMKDVVDAWKYVVRHGEVDLDGMPTSALGMSGVPSRPTNGSQIYIQPADEQDVHLNNLNMVAAVESCLQHKHRLCLQLHKIAGLA